MYKSVKEKRMKTLYKSIFVIGLGIISLTASAQKDSTLIRQVLLERDYNPTLQDASKINTTPFIYTPTVKTKDFQYISTAPQLTLGNNQLGSAESGDIKTNVDFNKRRGYVVLGAGSHSNIEAAAGYRILNSATDRLDIFATHSSTSGEVDYIDGKKYIIDDVKAKHSATKANLKYQHIFEPSILSLDASYYNTSYNYYGNSFYPSEYSTFPFDITSRQKVDVISVGAGLRSNDNNEGLLKYKGNVRYQYFKSKYSAYPKEDGEKGGLLDLDVDFYTAFGSDKTIGIKGFVMNQHFSDKTRAESYEDAFHGFTNITATPYIKFEGANWDVDLGVNVSGLFDVKTKMLFTPNVKASIHVNEVNTFYGEVTGGANNNTFLDILQENRYVDPSYRVWYSKTTFDAKIGFKSGIISGFEFDLFAGYKKTNDDHLYIFGTTNYYGDYGYGGYGPSAENLYWSNVSSPLNANVGTGHVGGLLKTNLIPYTDLSLKATAYFYSVKYPNGTYLYSPTEATYNPEKKAWGRPSFTAELRADVKPIDKFTFTLSYLYGGGRKALGYNDSTENYSSVSMKDINELNARAEFQILDWVSVYACANNLLFQKYELQYGYPLQGFNFLGGLNFKF